MIHTLKKSISQNKVVVLAIILISTTALIFFSVGAHSASLFGDEWGRVSQIIYDEIPCPRTYNIFMRPFSGCHIAMLNHIFGLNVPAFHFTTFLLLIIEALLFFFILHNIFTNQLLINICTATLFLIYPTIFTHLFFESVYAQTALIALLLALFVYIKYLKNKSFFLYILGTSLLIASIILYEGAIGLILLISFSYFLFSWIKDEKPNFLWIIPFLLAIGFSIGRWLSQTRVESAFGHQTSDIRFNIHELINRTITGLRVELQWGWTHAIQEIIPYHNFSLFQIMLLVLAIISFYIFLYFMIRRLPIDNHNAQPSLPYKHIFFTLIFSFLMIIAGYFPAVMAVTPGLEFLHSRVNILPNLGASIFIATLLVLFVRLLKLSPKQSNVFLLSLIIPMLLLAGHAQILSQSRIESAWQTQKEIWYQLFTLAPDLKAGTNVVLIFENFPYKEEAKPIMGGSWGFSSALSVLYGHNDLRGFFGFDHERDFIQKENGLQYYWTGDLIPYESMILLYYDGATNRLYFSSDDRLCKGCILPTQTNTTNYRYLVK